MLEEVRALLLGYVDHLERPVVPPPLQHLCEEPFDASTMPRECRMKEDQPRLPALESR
jgi:hypothetical protein